jgi:hypothetical protein
VEWLKVKALSSSPSTSKRKGKEKISKEALDSISFYHSKLLKQYSDALSVKRIAPF